MARNEIGTVDIKGTKFPVTVDEYGHFYSMWEGQEIGGKPTLDDLKILLHKAVREAAASIAVPFSVAKQVGPAGQRKWVIRQGNGIAIHAGNGNLIVEWPGGEREQASGRFGSALDASILQRLSRDDEERWLTLLVKFTHAQEALNRFEQERKINLKDKVRDELDRALREGQHGQD